MVTTIQVSIHRKGHNPIFDDGVTKLSIDDEGGGGFFILEQHDSQDGKLRFDPDELEAIAKEAKRLLFIYEANQNETHTKLPDHRVHDETLDEQP